MNLIAALRRASRGTLPRKPNRPKARSAHEQMLRDTVSSPARYALEGGAQAERVLIGKYGYTKRQLSALKSAGAVLSEAQALGNPGKVDEALWDRAKRIVRPHWDRYDQPWAVVQKVYRNLGGR